MNTTAAKIFTFVLFGALLLPLVACNSAYNAGTNPKQYPFLVAVTLQPHSLPSIEVAGTVQVGADAQYQVSATEFTDKDVTSSGDWSTSDPAVATVDRGLVTGTGIGSVTISATFGGKSASVRIFVGLTHDLTITPTGTLSLSTPNLTFHAIESFPDGTKVDVSGPAFWTASPGGIVSIYPYLGGDATLVGTGTTTVTATYDTGEAATADITVVP